MAGVDPRRHGWRARLQGLAFAVVGTLAALLLLIGMNRQLGGPDDNDGTPASSIEVVRKEKPKPKEVVRRPEPPKRKPSKTPPQPLPGLDAGLAGLDFGLPQFDASELEMGEGLLGDGSDLVMTDDTVDQAPRPIVQTRMQYPPRAKAQGITGYVVFNLLISPTGQVEQVRVLEAQPSGVFEAVAQAAVQQWKFEPASYKGENVRVWARQKVRFDLAGA